jgi:hypothetical protein
VSVADEITTSSADDLHYAAMILAADVFDALYGLNTAMPMVRYSSIAGMPSLSKDFPFLPELSAASLTEGVDMANTPYVTSKETITVSEVGLLLTLTRLQSITSIAEDGIYARSGAEAIAKKVTQDICALSAGFSNSVGSTGSDLTEANVLSALTTLMSNSVPGPYRAIIHPQQWSDLAAAIGGTITPAAAQGTGFEEVTNRLGAKPDGGLGTLYGVEWYLTAHVPTANAGADRSGMMVNPNRALGFVEKEAVRVDIEPDVSLRAREIAIVTTYGLGELDDNAGVAIVTDA